MPAFLALQCYNCFMMQVKQQKKSSNKWICSICNEKQSVRNVFASSLSAKDIRAFVQEFNLSRNRNPLQDHNSVDANSCPRAKMEIEEGEGEKRGGKGSSDLHEEAASRCLHAQRKISQETQLSGEFRSSDSVKKASKWDEFLAPQENDIPGILEDTSQYEGKFTSLFPEVRDDEFVTEFPETRKLKRKSLNETPHNKSTVQISHKSQRNKSGIFSNKFQKENYLQFGLHKSSSSVKVQSNDDVHIPQVLTRPCEGPLEEFKAERNSVLESQRPISKPISKWATFLDPCETLGNQPNIGNLKEEVQVISKWETYGISDHANRTVDRIEYHKSVIKSGNSDDETLVVSERIPGKANVWSLETNLVSLDSLVTTQLD